MSFSENLYMDESLTENKGSTSESIDSVDASADHWSHGGIAQAQKDPMFLPDDVVSFIDEEGTTIRGVFADDVDLSFGNWSLSDKKAEKFKISTYPSKKVVHKQSEELKLLHRPFMLGEVVRRGKSDEIGTVVAIEFESDVRVPGTNLELEKISSKRLLSCDPTFYGQKVALNGWIGEITKYKSKTGSMAETGSFSSSDEVEVNWVACGKNEPSPKPNSKVDSSELPQLQAPWNQENTAYKNSDTATKFWGVLLYDRFRIKLTNEEAQSLNRMLKSQEVDPSEFRHFAKPSHSKKGKKLSSDDFLEMLTKIANDDEKSSYICLRFPNFMVDTYEGESRTYLDGMDHEDSKPKVISSLFETIFKNEKVDKEGMKNKVNRVFEEIEKLLGKKYSLGSMNIHFDEKNIEFLLEEKSSLEGAANFQFEEESWICIEVATCTSICKVQWQSGEIEDCDSTGLSTCSNHSQWRKFLPGNYVVRKNQENLAEWGSVVSVDFAKKQVVVKWFIDETTKERETISFNDATAHPVFKFPLGSLVVSNSSSQINCPGVGMVKGFLSCGKLEIMWADRTESPVFPTQLTPESVLFPKEDYSWPMESEAGYGMSEEGGSKTTEEKISEITEPVIDDVPIADLGQVHFLEDPSPTHAFFNSKNDHSKSFLKIYNSEISRLQTSIPKGVHLWAYESRLDLLSFAIEGPAGTPYEHCLFCFDICLPDGYPLTSPPKVRYRSTLDRRINPNLYDDGKVCLSLLGTWAGNGCEKWKYTSNLLQLLVSLQGLTLNAEPYFNEPGYEKTRKTDAGVNGSRKYNQDITKYLCQHVITTIRNPGQPFEELVKEFYFGSKLEKKEGVIGKFIDKMEKLTGENPEDLAYPLLPIVDKLKSTLSAKIETLKEIKSEEEKEATSSA
ncbi:Oidioi.mRNA.OKI2018_I69.XSR.g13723.t1.cds [Oikopleura dioica]|uniref:Oidioi.mRNA.OKI2018_I69.XSR.g13723.t1.cds n=1 Tax=Oikopleura dioica TaxID=34765 RepID=A0ABN7SCF7_OIKDI|nr:Oidioi.mRNA.OKI2018_I69.XSR.g13723.t1.cds [Oikopleura dioica]